jgi:hypothetical protein
LDKQYSALYKTSAEDNLFAGFITIILLTISINYCEKLDEIGLYSPLVILLNKSIKLIDYPLFRKGDLSSAI